MINFINMKTNIKTLTFLTLLIGITSCSKETKIENSNVPLAIKNYINEKFSNHSIITTIEDKDGFKTTYDVYLSNNLKLEFNKKYEIIEIDSDSALSSNVINPEIYNYVMTNYPNNFITDWELDGNRQKIGLYNDLDLIFDKNHQFIKIDN